MDLARVMDNLCQRLQVADEKYAEYLRHIETLYERDATEREKEIAWVWLRSAQIDREYLRKSFSKDAIPLFAVSEAARDFASDKH